MNENEMELNQTPSVPEEASAPINPAPDFILRAPEPVFDPPVPVAAPETASFADHEPRKPRKKRGVSAGTFIAVILVFAILLGCSGMSVYMLYNYCQELQESQDALSDYCKELENTQQQNQANINTLRDKLDALSGKDSTNGTEALLTPNQIYAMNVDAVVSVSCQVSSGFSSGYSTGSGFIISADGYVLTNAHVVDQAKEIRILTYDDRELVAKLIGKDSLNDVAVLKVEGENFPHVTLGSSANVVVGEQVAAIGNPLGSLSFSLTVGYVSAKDRIINTEGTSTNMIQSDVAINSGNSGGPLFNMAGQVIGITSAKYSGESSSGATIEGISFAIPIDDVMALLPELKENGGVSYAYLGVSVRDIRANAETGAPAGAEVAETFDGFTAQKSGILAGDIIVKADKYPVTSVSSLTMALKNFKPGNKIDVVVYRDGSEVTISVTLDARPEE